MTRQFTFNSHVYVIEERLAKGGRKETCRAARTQIQKERIIFDITEISPSVGKCCLSSKFEVFAIKNRKHINSITLSEVYWISTRIALSV